MDLTNWSTVACFRHLWGAGGEAVLPTLLYAWTLQTGPLSSVSDTFEVQEAKLFFPLCCTRGPYKLVYCRLFQTPLRCTRRSCSSHFAVRGPYKLVHCCLFQTPLRCRRRSCSSHFAVSVDLTNWSTVTCFRHLWGARGEAVLPTLLYVWTLQTGPLLPVSDTFEVQEAKLFFPLCCTRGPYKLVYCCLFQTPLRCTRRSCSSHFAVRVDLTNWSTVACFRHLWGARGEAVLPTLLYVDLTNWSTVACFRHLWGARGEAVLPTLLYTWTLQTGLLLPVSDTFEVQEAKLFFPLCCTWTLQTGLLSPVSDTFEVHEAKLFFPLCCMRGPYKLVYCHLFQTPLRCRRRSCSSHFAVCVDLTNWSTVACFRHLWGAGGEAVLPTLLYVDLTNWSTVACFRHLWGARGEAVLPTLLYVWTLQTGLLSPVSDTFEMQEAKLFFPLCCTWTLQTGLLSPVSDTFEVQEAKLFFPLCCMCGPYKLVHCCLFQTPLRCRRRSCSSHFTVSVDLTNWSTVTCFRHLWGPGGEAVLPTLLYAWTLQTGPLSSVSDTFEVHEAKLFFPLCCMRGPYKLVYCHLFQTPLRSRRRSCSSHFDVRVDLTNWSTVVCFRHLWGARGEAVLPTLLYAWTLQTGLLSPVSDTFEVQEAKLFFPLCCTWTLQTGLLSPVSDTFEVHEAKLFFPLCCTRGPYKLVYCRLFQTPLRCRRRSCSSHFAVSVDLTNWSTVACFRHLWGAGGEAVLPTLLYVDLTNWSTVACFRHLWGAGGEAVLPTLLYVDLTNWSTVACFRHLWDAGGEAVLPTLL